MVLNSYPCDKSHSMDHGKAVSIFFEDFGES